MGRSLLSGGVDCTCPDISRYVYFITDSSDSWDVTSIKRKKKKKMTLGPARFRSSDFGKMTKIGVLYSIRFVVEEAISDLWIVRKSCCCSCWAEWGRPRRIRTRRIKWKHMLRTESNMKDIWRILRRKRGKKVTSMTTRFQYAEPDFVFLL